MPILRELVISGGANSVNFHEPDVQPSVLYSLAVPSRYTRVYSHMQIYMIMCTFTHYSLAVPSWVHIFTYLYTCVYTYVYAHVCTLTHSLEYTHTYT